MSNELKNLVWEQKYRPKTIDDTILPQHIKDTIKDVIKSGDIPNYLFSGTHGIGKTTLAYAIAAELGADLLYVNSSLNGNIDTLRTTITQFVSTVSFSDAKKIVFLDEADGLNPVSTQPALRGFLDEFSTNAIFILTCNYKSRIIAPLLESRLTTIDFRFAKEEKQAAAISMLKRVCHILDTEQVKYDKKVVASVVSNNFPDFRKTLNQLQSYSTSGEIDSGILGITSGNLDELVSFIKTKDFPKVRQWIANNQLDSQSFYRGLYDKLFSGLTPSSIPQAILIIAESQFQASNGAVDPEINQVAAVIKIMGSVVFK